MISSYTDTQTWLHIVPASVKLLFLAFIGLVILPVENLLQIIVFASVVISLYIFSGLNFLKCIFLLKPLLPFVVVILALHFWLGTIDAGFVAAIRLMSMILLANIITMTTKLSDMILVIEGVFKVFDKKGDKSKQFSLAIVLCFRLLQFWLNCGTI